jgi:hypothetical protein
MMEMMMSVSKDKYCVDCVHYRENAGDYCLRVKPVSPVSGLPEQKWLFCESERGKIGVGCGPEGYYFDPKVKPLVIQGHKKSTEILDHEVSSSDWYCYAMAAFVMLSVWAIVLYKL